MNSNAVNNNPHVTLDHKRDAYGFTVRPQHVQRYREYANIYKEEEEERSDRWKNFLERISTSAEFPAERLSENVAYKEDEVVAKQAIAAEGLEDVHQQNDVEVDGMNILEATSGDQSEQVPEEVVTPAEQEKRTHRVKIWSNVRPSLHAIEDVMSLRVRRRNLSGKELISGTGKPLFSIEEARFVRGALEEDSEEEFYDVEKSDPVQDVPSMGNGTSPATPGIGDVLLSQSGSPWKEELEVLVRGGVPMALRGELWQAFVGVRARRVENYYQDLLSTNCALVNDKKQGEMNNNGPNNEKPDLHEKWKGQIEKDLPRTFPGHPALDEDGRNALRRLLIAYARHNPYVGYCQAMNFFAGLLLLLMPEENAFWALMGIMDDYFDGYYSEEMIESQVLYSVIFRRACLLFDQEAVDQLVFEELVRERFPKLVNHLDYLGVQVAWVTGPWFLSIFMNMLPWESVLRVWDVLLFEGNRVMLFRTALSLMELYGPSLVTTKDAGDAVTLLQSLAGSTFDSSQLVLTACMGFQNVNETRLQELRDKHRPTVMAAIEERSKGLQAWKNAQALASKLYSLKHDPQSAMNETKKSKVVDEKTNGDLSHSGSTSPEDVYIGLNGGVEIDVALDLQEQVTWLKVELCRQLDEKRSAVLRAEELEIALMEMVKQDNRRILSAKVEQLEQEISELRRALSDKQEQEHVMLQVLMRVEQEQKVTEDARRFAEQEAEALRDAAQVLQKKNEEAISSLAEMEKRAVMAESMLEATLQYQSGQIKAQASPRSVQCDSIPRGSNGEVVSELPARKISLLARPFGLGWVDKNKGMSANLENQSDVKTHADEMESESHIALHKEINGHQVEEKLST